jgi:calcium binding protein 39
MLVAFPEFQDVYLADERNLALVMRLVLSAFRNISLEAFHVFKHFVESQKKPDSVVKILAVNAQRLISVIQLLFSGVENPASPHPEDGLIQQLQMLVPAGDSPDAPGPEKDQT